MKPNVRAAIAAVAISHATGRPVSSIYVYGDGYKNIDAKVAGDRVDAYDYSSGAHFDGNMPSLYHYGEGSHVDFKHDGGPRYSGYEYGSGSPFEVTVNGTTAELYDYGAGGFFNFSL